MREIRAMFEQDVTVRSIYEPLKACPSSESAEEMRRLLTDRGFDVAGMKEPETDLITRFVTVDTLKRGGTIGEHAQPISVGDLISDATPLAQIFSLLGRRNYAFVLTGGVVTAIVTRADLNKPPARIYLFALVSLLEMHLVFWIRKEFGDGWKESLKQLRLDAAQKLFDDRRAMHQELDLCECLQICDKGDIVITNENLRALFAIPSKNGGNKLFSRIQTLRDLLAHGQRSLVEGTTWEEFSSVVEWLEQALGNSDARIEQVAAEAGRNYVEQFWRAGDR